MSRLDDAEQLPTPDLCTGSASVSGSNSIPVPVQPLSIARRIQLSNGYSVTPEFMYEIRLHIEGRLPGLHPEGRYTAKQLAGKAFWDLLSSGDQRTAGRCIAYMAVHQLLPLVFVKGPHEYPLRYRLI